LFVFMMLLNGTNAFILLSFRGKNQAILVPTRKFSLRGATKFNPYFKTPEQTLKGNNHIHIEKLKRGSTHLGFPIEENRDQRFRSIPMSDVAVTFLGTASCCKSFCL